MFSMFKKFKKEQPSAHDLKKELDSLAEEKRPIEERYVRELAISSSKEDKKGGTTHTSAELEQATKNLTKVNKAILKKQGTLRKLYGETYPLPNLDNTSKKRHSFGK